MRIGDVASFSTKKADNHRKKYKWHVCVGVNPHLFFFINTSGVSREGVMWLRRDEWEKRGSFISVDKINIHSDADLDRKKSGFRHRGRLPDSALARLRDHVLEVGLLTGRETDTVVKNINDYLSAGKP